MAGIRFLVPSVFILHVAGSTNPLLGNRMLGSGRQGFYYVSSPDPNQEGEWRHVWDSTSASHRHSGAGDGNGSQVPFVQDGFQNDANDQRIAPHRSNKSRVVTNPESAPALERNSLWGNLARCVMKFCLCTGTMDDERNLSAETGPQTGLLTGGAHDSLRNQNYGRNGDASVAKRSRSFGHGDRRDHVDTSPILRQTAGQASPLRVRDRCQSVDSRWCKRGYLIC